MPTRPVSPMDDSDSSDREISVCQQPFFSWKDVNASTPSVPRKGLLENILKTLYNSARVVAETTSDNIPIRMGDIDQHVRVTKQMLMHVNSGPCRPNVTPICRGGKRAEFSCPKTDNVDDEIEDDTCNDDEDEEEEEEEEAEEMEEDEEDECVNRCARACRDPPEADEVTEEEEEAEEECPEEKKETPKDDIPEEEAAELYKECLYMNTEELRAICRKYKNYDKQAHVKRPSTKRRKEDGECAEMETCYPDEEGEEEDDDNDDLGNEDNIDDGPEYHGIERPCTPIQCPPSANRSRKEKGEERTDKETRYHGKERPCRSPVRPPREESKSDNKGVCSPKRSVPNYERYNQVGERESDHGSLYTDRCGPKGPQNGHKDPCSEKQQTKICKKCVCTCSEDDDDSIYTDDKKKKKEGKKIFICYEEDDDMLKCLQQKRKKVFTCYEAAKVKERYREDDLMGRNKRVFVWFEEDDDMGTYMDDFCDNNYNHKTVTAPSPALKVVEDQASGKSWNTALPAVKSSQGSLESSPSSYRGWGSAWSMLKGSEPLPGQSSPVEPRLYEGWSGGWPAVRGSQPTLDHTSPIDTEPYEGWGNSWPAIQGTERSLGQNYYAKTEECSMYYGTLERSDVINPRNIERENRIQQSSTVPKVDTIYFPHTVSADFFLGEDTNHFAYFSENSNFNNIYYDDDETSSDGSIEEESDEDEDADDSRDDDEKEQAEESGESNSDGNSDNLPADVEDEDDAFFLSGSGTLEEGELSLCQSNNNDVEPADQKQAKYKAYGQGQDDDETYFTSIENAADNFVPEAMESHDFSSSSRAYMGGCVPPENTSGGAFPTEVMYQRGSDHDTMEIVHPLVEEKPPLEMNVANIASSSFDRCKRMLQSLTQRASCDEHETHLVSNDKEKKYTPRESPRSVQRQPRSYTYSSIEVRPGTSRHQSNQADTQKAGNNKSSGLLNIIVGMINGSQTNKKDDFGKHKSGITSKITDKSPKSAKSSASKTQSFTFSRFRDRSKDRALERAGYLVQRTSPVNPRGSRSFKFADHKAKSLERQLEQAKIMEAALDFEPIKDISRKIPAHRSQSVNMEKHRHNFKFGHSPDRISSKYPHGKARSPEGLPSRPEGGFDIGRFQKKKWLTTLEQSGILLARLRHRSPFDSVSHEEDNLLGALVLKKTAGEQSGSCTNILTEAFENANTNSKVADRDSDWPAERVVMTGGSKTQPYGFVEMDVASRSERSPIGLLQRRGSPIVGSGQRLRGKDGTQLIRWPHQPRFSQQTAAGEDTARDEKGSKSFSGEAKVIRVKSKELFENIQRLVKAKEHESKSAVVEETKDEPKHSKPRRRPPKSSANRQMRSETQATQEIPNQNATTPTTSEYQGKYSNLLKNLKLSGKMKHTPVGPTVLPSSSPRYGLHREKNNNRGLPEEESPQLNALHIHAAMEGPIVVGVSPGVQSGNVDCMLGLAFSGKDLESRKAHHHGRDHSDPMVNDVPVDNTFNVIEHCDDMLFLPHQCCQRRSHWEQNEDSSYEDTGLRFQESIVPQYIPSNLEFPLNFHQGNRGVNGNGIVKDIAALMEQQHAIRGGEQHSSYGPANCEGNVFLTALNPETKARFITENAVTWQTKHLVHNMASTGSSVSPADNHRTNTSLNYKHRHALANPSPGRSRKGRVSYMSKNGNNSHLSYIFSASSSSDAAEDDEDDDDDEDDYEEEEDDEEEEDIYAESADEDFGEENVVNSSSNNNLEQHTVKRSKSPSPGRGSSNSHYVGTSPGKPAQLSPAAATAMQVLSAKVMAGGDSAIRSSAAESSPVKTASDPAVSPNRKMVDSLSNKKQFQVETCSYRNEFPRTSRQSPQVSPLNRSRLAPRESGLGHGRTESSSPSRLHQMAGGPQGQLAYRAPTLHDESLSSKHADWPVQRSPFMSDSFKYANHGKSNSNEDENASKDPDLMYRSDILDAVWSENAYSLNREQKGTGKKYKMYRGLPDRTKEDNMESPGPPADITDVEGSESSDNFGPTVLEPNIQDVENVDSTLMATDETDRDLPGSDETSIADAGNGETAKDVTEVSEKLQEENPPRDSRTQSSPTQKTKPKWHSPNWKSNKPSSPRRGSPRKFRHSDVKRQDNSDFMNETNSKLSTLSQSKEWNETETSEVGKMDKQQDMAVSQSDTSFKRPYASRSDGKKERETLEAIKTVRQLGSSISKNDTSSKRPSVSKSKEQRGRTTEEVSRTAKASAAEKIEETHAKTVAESQVQNQQATDEVSAPEKPKKKLFRDYHDNLKAKRAVKSKATEPVPEETKAELCESEHQKAVSADVAAPAKSKKKVFRLDYYDTLRENERKKEVIRTEGSAVDPPKPDRKKSKSSHNFITDDKKSEPDPHSKDKKKKYVPGFGSYDFYGGMSKDIHKAEQGKSSSSHNMAVEKRSRDTGQRDSKKVAAGRTRDSEPYIEGLDSRSNQKHKTEGKKTPTYKIDSKTGGQVDRTAYNKGKQSSQKFPGESSYPRSEAKKSPKDRDPPKYVTTSTRDPGPTFLPTLLSKQKVSHGVTSYKIQSGEGSHIAIKPRALTQPDTGTELGPEKSVVDTLAQVCKNDFKSSANTGKDLAVASSLGQKKKTAQGLVSKSSKPTTAKGSDKRQEGDSFFDLHPRPSLVHSSRPGIRESEGDTGSRTITNINRNSRHPMGLYKNDTQYGRRGDTGDYSPDVNKRSIPGLYVQRAEEIYRPSKQPHSVGNPTAVSFLKTKSKDRAERQSSPSYYTSEDGGAQRKEGSSSSVEEEEEEEEESSQEAEWYDSPRHGAGHFPTRDYTEMRTSNEMTTGHLDHYLRGRANPIPDLCGTKHSAGQDRPVITDTGNRHDKGPTTSYKITSQGGKREITPAYTSGPQKQARTEPDTTRAQSGVSSAQVKSHDRRSNQEKTTPCYTHVPPYTPPQRGSAGKKEKEQRDFLPPTPTVTTPTPTAVVAPEETPSAGSGDGCTGTGVAQIQQPSNPGLFSRILQTFSLQKSSQPLKEDKTETIIEKAGGGEGATAAPDPTPFKQSVQGKEETGAQRKERVRRPNSPHYKGARNLRPDYKANVSSNAHSPCDFTTYNRAHKLDILDLGTNPWRPAAPDRNGHNEVSQKGNEGSSSRSIQDNLPQHLQ